MRYETLRKRIKAGDTIVLPWRDALSLWYALSEATKGGPRDEVVVHLPKESPLEPKIGSLP